jgi:purine-binding chemotaxis protein CheW
MINIQVNTSANSFDPQSKTSADDTESHLTFTLADQTYAVSLTSIREVRKMPPLTRVAHAPNYILGVGSIRGEIVPIVDLRKRFAIEMNAEGLTTSMNRMQDRLILITEIDAKRAAVTVDSISEVAKFSKSQMSEIPKTTMAIDLKYLHGMVQHEGKVLLLIDLKKILEPEELHSSLAQVAVTNASETVAA